MKIVQAIKIQNTDWHYSTKKQQLKNPLVFIFGERMLLDNPDNYSMIQQEFPYQHTVYCSTAGEVIGNQVYDQSIVVTAIEFENSSFDIFSDNLNNHQKDSYQVGSAISAKIKHKNLIHLFVIADGISTNGSELIKGLEKNIPNEIPISGGLSGDDTRFEKTLASYHSSPKEGEIVVIAFYGENLTITTGAHGSWIPFGPTRIVTKSQNNLLYELDGEAAIATYQKYVNDSIKDLRKASLFFPLILYRNNTRPIVRTFLDIDEKNNCIILAGDIPENSKVQLGMSSVDQIMSGTEIAAKQAIPQKSDHHSLIMIVSCIGRKLMMDQRIEEEIEEISFIGGTKATLCGFYSYGEIAPSLSGGHCDLHNQTITLTFFSEKL